MICLQHEAALGTSELDHELGLRLFAAFLGLCPLRGNPLRILLDVRYQAMGGVALPLSRELVVSLHKVVSCET